MTRQDYLDKLFCTYRLIRTLSEKNGCQTLQVRHKTLERDMVVHSLPRSLPIYELLCRIRADGLPEIYDTRNCADGQLVLEEYIDGLTAAQVMETGRYTYAGAKRVIRSLCGAVDILHRNGFVHRDIKPENILISATGRVTLIDFNAVRRILPEGRDTEILGTVGYASPEQLGIRQSDTRTDIYAIGILLNVLLTGKHPSEQTAGGRAGRIVRRCTRIHPDDRFQTVRQLASRL